MYCGKNCLISKPEAAYRMPGGSVWTLKILVTYEFFELVSHREAILSRKKKKVFIKCIV